MPGLGSRFMREFYGPSYGHGVRGPRSRIANARLPPPARPVRMEAPGRATSRGLSDSNVGVVQCCSPKTSRPRTALAHRRPAVPPPPTHTLSLVRLYCRTRPVAACGHRASPRHGRPPGHHRGQRGGKGTHLTDASGVGRLRAGTGRPVPAAPPVVRRRVGRDHGTGCAACAGRWSRPTPAREPWWSAWRP